MFTLNATDARRAWSTLIENTVREKPQFVKRTRDYIILTELNLFEDILSAYQYTADKFVEDDGSVTLSLNEVDLVENGKTESEARLLLGKSILEYAETYYNEYKLYSAAPNRKGHVPYVLKAIIIDDPKKIGDSILCQAGKI